MYVTTIGLTLQNFLKQTMFVASSLLVVLKIIKTINALTNIELKNSNIVVLRYFPGIFYSARKFFKVD